MPCPAMCPGRAMTLAGTLLLIAAVLSTSMLSGIFGMVGGMILLWLLLLLMPVTAAIAVQGVLQLVANLSRAWFARAWIDLAILRNTTAGVLGAVALLLLVDYTPSILVVSIAVGLLPVFCYLPRRWLVLDATRPHHAMICGFLGGGLNVSVGVAGPIVDIFFARTSMDRRAVIGTKATLQLLSHVAKIVFYAASLSGLSTAEITAIGLAMPFSVLGSVLGHTILVRMTDDGFRRGTIALVTGVGLFYLAQGLHMLAS